MASEITGRVIPTSTTYFSVQLTPRSKGSSCDFGVFSLSLSLSLFSPSPSPRRVGTLSRCTRTGGVHGREAIVIRENLTLALDTKEMRMEVIMLRNRGGWCLDVIENSIPFNTRFIRLLSDGRGGRRLLSIVVARVIFKAKRMLRLNYGHRFVFTGIRELLYYLLIIFLCIPSRGWDAVSNEINIYPRLSVP